MAKAFSPILEENVWLTGLPRNDLILKEERLLPADYKQQLANLRRKVSGRKLVLYAPTWRQSREGVFAYSPKQKRTIESLMEKHNAVFAIRRHANEQEGSQYQGQVSESGIIDVSDFPDVNLILRETEVLITDYSSIYIDFLLMNKPILHFTYDIDRYIGERGFLYNFEDAIAGPYFCSFKELIDHLDSALASQNPRHCKHSSATELFHTHTRQSAKEATTKIKSLCL